MAPKRARASLRSLTGLELSVVSAEPIAASDAGPAHCLVRAFVQPEIEIEVALPERWNLSNGGEWRFWRGLAVLAGSVDDAANFTCGQ